jgi:hypothetical protein
MIPFHQQALFTIEVEAPADANIELPVMADRFGGLAVYGTPGRTYAPGSDQTRQRITETYLLDAISPGNYVVEPVTVRWEGGETTLPGPVVQVRDLTPEEVDAIMIFQPNAETYTAQRPWWRNVWIWIVLAVAVLALALWLWRRKRSELGVPTPGPQASPWDVAYDRLRKLDARGLPEKGEHEPYYVALSAILRHYIEDRFSVHAPEMTTPEFLAEAGQSGFFGEAQQEMLSKFLRRGDRVKFAQYRPSKEEMEHSFTHVLQFVDDTVPKVDPAPEEAA